jgi:hypothetical protein
MARHLKPASYLSRTKNQKLSPASARDLLDFSFRAPNNKIFQSTTSQVDKKEDFRHVGYHIYPILTFYLHLPYPCSFRFMMRSLTMKPSNIYIYIWTCDLFFLQLAGLFISSYKYIDHVHDHKRIRAILWKSFIYSHFHILICLKISFCRLR